MPRRSRWQPLTLQRPGPLHQGAWLQDRDAAVPMPAAAVVKAPEGCAEAAGASWLTAGAFKFLRTRPPRTLCFIAFYWGARHILRDLPINISSHVQTAAETRGWR